VRLTKAAANFLCFALTFTLEVRVKAADLEKHAATLPTAYEVQEVPTGCLKDTELCAIKTYPSEKFKLKIGSADVVLDSTAALIRLSDHQIEYVSGVVWVKSDKEFSIRTEFGEIFLPEGAQVWLSRDASSVKIAATEGYVSVLPRGGKQKIAVDSGFENTLTKVDSSGVAESAAPMAIDFKNHVERWARLYDGKKVDFEKEVSQFHMVWVEAREKAAHIHQNLYERKVASVKYEQSRLAESRRAEEIKNRELRKSFRRHYYEALGLGGDSSSPSP
jgi:hypothetical protein